MKNNRFKKGEEKIQERETEKEITTSFRKWKNLPCDMLMEIYNALEKLILALYDVYDVALYEA